MGGRRRVSRYEQLAGNVDDAEEAGQPVHEVQHACDPRAVFLVEFIPSLLCR